jgi:hypothetical protein
MRIAGNRTHAAVASFVCIKYPDTYHRLVDIVAAADIVVHAETSVCGLRIAVVREQ